MNYTQAFNLLMSLEFNSPSNALHKNPTENGLTFMGIYETANPNWQGWGQVRAAINAYGDMKKASVALYNDDDLVAQVGKFYKINYWDVMRLDEINSYQKQAEMFIFGVNAGCKNAIKAAQKVVGVTMDGILGAITLAAINAYNEVSFNKDYDRAEIAYYRAIISANPTLARYERGWINRAEKV
jgi:hypothetical protein